MTKLFLLFLILIPFNITAKEYPFFWEEGEGCSFGQALSKVVVEKILNQPVTLRPLYSSQKIVLSGGSLLHSAREGDIVWGTGFRFNPLTMKKFKHLDVRAVRGPRTREYLLKMGIDCPEVYGDPVILMGRLFPEYKAKPTNDYIIIPNVHEITYFSEYKNVVLPTLPWDEVLAKIIEAKLVISSSLHGIMLAEAFGVPTRMLKMTWSEPLLKYQDYYEATGRPNFEYATSVQEALEMKGEEAGFIDTEKFLRSFPWNYFKN